MFGIRRKEEVHMETEDRKEQINQMLKLVEDNDLLEIIIHFLEGLLG